MKRLIAGLFVLCVFGTGLRAQGGAGGTETGDGNTVGNASEWEFPSKENLPRINELPDPFLKPDGSRVATPEEWPEQREYLKAMLSHYMYGEVPPAPQKVEGVILSSIGAYGGRAIEEMVEISFSPDDRPDVRVAFLARVLRPNVKDRVPVFVWNQFSETRFQGCPIEEEVVCGRGYAIVEFLREQLAPDSVEAMGGQLAQAYPNYSWGTIAMWSWGSSRVIDYLETTAWADMDEIIATGHSRGGKSALHTAIYDERVALCAANGSGCGGGGCLRFLGSRLGEGYGRCETAGWIYDCFPYWWTDEFGEFGKRQNGLNHGNMAGVDMTAVIKSMTRPMAADGVEEEFYLPFDLHFVKALVAPRALICTEGSGDTWANTYGTHITWIAADEVFQFLGAAGRNALHYREGQHDYLSADWLATVDFCDQIFFGKKAVSPYMVNPSTTDPNYIKGTATNFHYSWKRP